MTSSDRFLNSNLSELEDANYSPINGYQNLPLMTLEKAIENIISLDSHVINYAATAKEKCNRDSNFLTWDESAAIYLYTMPTSFFSRLNENLRARDRQALKPWFAFLKLFLDALEKFPSHKIIVWRGVTNDVALSFIANSKITWWSISSCSQDAQVVQPFVGENGFLFNIEVINGKDISMYSAVAEEREVILMPGTHLRVKGNSLNFQNLLVVVQLKEESTTEQNTQGDNVTILSAPQLSLTNSTNPNTNVNDDATSLLPHNQNVPVNEKKLGIMSTIILIVMTLVILVLPTIISIISVKLIFRTTSYYSPSTNTHTLYRTSTMRMNVHLTQEIFTTHKLPTKVCSHRPYRVVADILYSFDCSNVTDDVTGTYNGMDAIPSWMSYYNRWRQYELPRYVGPDYSGQGIALQLDSSEIFQYIELVRSPIFFNKTFAISVWLNPNVQTSIVYCLLRQVYRSAPELGFSIVDMHVVMRVYGTVLWSIRKLKNFQWQHVTLTFSQQDMLMSIYIDGILDATSSIEHPKYGNFEIQRTTIGSCEILNQYNGVMDQLAIVFRIKNRIDILDEATLIVHYNFEDDGIESDLFKDISVNSIRTQQSYVSQSTDSRHRGHSTLSLYDSALSYFQTGGFVLLSTYNYSYSYALWLHVSNVSSFMPLIHLIAKNELYSFESNSGKCLAVLTINATDNNHFQVSVYIYKSSNPIVITSTTLISYSTWFHVVVMSGTNSFSLYINGILVGSATVTESNMIILNNRDRLTITIGNPARSVNNNPLYYSICSIDTSGTRLSESVIGIDDLRFYSRELKIKEIEALNNDDHNPTKFFFE